MSWTAFVEGMEEKKGEVNDRVAFVREVVLDEPVVLYATKLAVGDNLAVTCPGAPDVHTLLVKGLQPEYR